MTGLGIVASYSLRFWTLVIGLGVITGLASAGLIGLLRLVERISYGVHRSSLLAAVESVPGWRRIVVLLVAAVIVIVGLRVMGELIERRDRSHRGDLAALGKARLRSQHRSRRAVDRDRRHGRFAGT